jgi:hypothetical protein
VEEEELKVEKAKEEEEGENAGNSPSICALMSSDRVFTTRHNSSTLFSWMIRGLRKSPVKGTAQQREGEHRREKVIRKERRGEGRGEIVSKVFFIQPCGAIRLPSAITLTYPTHHTTQHHTTPQHNTPHHTTPHHPHSPVALDMLSMMLTTSELVFTLGFALGGRERD